MFLLIMLSNIWKYIKYWYFRYLMVTELYMVERWERHVINSVALILFCILWYFNMQYFVTAMSKATSFAISSSETTGG